MPSLVSGHLVPNQPGESTLVTKEMLRESAPRRASPPWGWGAARPLLTFLRRNTSKDTDPRGRLSSPKPLPPTRWTSSLLLGPQWTPELGCGQHLAGGQGPSLAQGSAAVSGSAWGLGSRCAGQPALGPHDLVAHSFTTLGGCGVWVVLKSVLWEPLRWATTLHQRGQRAPGQ